MESTEPGYFRITGLKIMLTAGIQRPYIYGLRKSECVYIGMTLDHPVFRWASSFKQGGSFYSALERVDETLPQTKENIRSAAFECTEVLEQVPYFDWRTVVCYAEHQIHIMFTEDRWVLGSEIDLISDTVRTAPRRCKYDWVHNMSERIFFEIVDALK